MNARFATTLLTTAAVVLASRAALAAEENAPAAESASLRGLEVMLRPAFGGAPDGSPVVFAPKPGARVAGDFGDILGGRAAPYGPGFVGQAFVGYRFHPLVSGGLRAGLRTASAGPVNDGSTGLGRSSWDAGFYLRAYPLAANERARRLFDPWVSVGVGYMRDLQAFQVQARTTTGQAVSAKATLDHHAVAIPIGLGVDFRVHRMLSVGPSFEYTLASAITGCARQAAAGYAEMAYCSSAGPGKDFIRADTYGVWTAGADVRVTF